MSGNFFLKLEGIEGDATQPDHKGEIAVLSWSHSFNQPTRSPAGTVEQANHADFSIVKYLDSATTHLLQKCWSGKPIAKAVFTAWRADGDNKPVRNLLIELSGVIVSNCSIAGGQGDLPTETVTLHYGAAAYTYFKPGGPADGHKVTHDVAKQMVT